MPGTGCQSLSVELGFWIIIASGIPDSLSCIPDSKDQGFAFHRQKISWIPLPGATSTISNFSKISTIEKQSVSLSQATSFPGLFSKKKWEEPWGQGCVASQELGPAQAYSQLNGKGSREPSEAYFNFSSTVFYLSVGIAASCSIETLQETAKTCVNGFYDNLKTDPHQNCR